MNFSLDPQLDQDCHVLGKLELCQVLLMDNAALPWFILVPETTLIELCDLPQSEQHQLLSEANRVAEFIRNEFSVDKLNLGAIGNVVSQMHVHVIGRRYTDYCWPNPVWGTPAPETYTAGDVTRVRQLAISILNLVEV